jgi:hypothetical protein
MKKYLLGFLSVLLLFASIAGASSKKPKSDRDGRAAGGQGMWV